MTSQQTIEYVASALFAAMLRGGICFFDEIGKAPISALDPLASVLDDRRSLTSVLAGIHLRAHPDFLFCAALNQNEEEGLGLPGFIDERTRPAIKVGYPARPILEQIVRAHLPMAADSWFKLFVDLFPEEMSPRTANKLLGYAYRLAVLDDNLRPSARQIKRYLKQAHRQVAAGQEKRGGKLNETRVCPAAELPAPQTAPLARPGGCRSAPVYSGPAGLCRADCQLVASGQLSSLAGGPALFYEPRGVADRTVKLFTGPQPHRLCIPGRPPPGPGFHPQ